MANVEPVLFKGVQVDQNVIDVDIDKPVQKVPKDIADKGLKYGQSIKKAEGHEETS